MKRSPRIAANDMLRLAAILLLHLDENILELALTVNVYVGNVVHLSANCNSLSKRSSAKESRKRRISANLEKNSCSHRGRSSEDVTSSAAITSAAFLSLCSFFGTLCRFLFASEASGFFSISSSFSSDSISQFRFSSPTYPHSHS